MVGNLCTLKSFTKCIVLSSKSMKYCVQDEPAVSGSRIKGKTVSATVLFDGGSQTALVRYKFA